MKWFGARAGREGARPVLSRSGVAGIGWVQGGGPPSYEAQVRDGYCRNAIAQRAVKLVAEAVGNAPLLASDPALVALATARSGRQPLVETAAAQLLLHGNAFIQVLRDADGNVAELFALRPGRVGGARWRLSRLLRGRRGTEAAAGAQAVGDRFVLLDYDSLRSLDLPLATLGSEVRVMASGVGDTGGPIEAAVTITGRSVMPPSPAHLDAVVEADGSAAVGWVRRSRAGWRWIDGVDAPLGEESEVYRVAVTTADGAVRDGETGDATITVTAAERAIGPAAVTVSQRGTQGLSPAITLNIEGE